MPILPNRTQDLIEFFEMHAPVWTANAAAIGITPAAATAFATLAAASRAAYNARLAAEEAARVATVNLQNAVSDARHSASDLIRTIKAFAENAPKPDIIYNLAQIPAPAEPTPAPPPAKPSDLTVTLMPTTGELELRWKAQNPRGTTGTSYIVRRRNEGQAEFAFVGVTGEKRFIDRTLIAGPDSVEYTVQGQRADAAGEVSDIFIINFGRTGPGLMTIASITPKSQAA
jgi:hypothetical protein